MKSIKFSHRYAKLLTGSTENPPVVIGQAILLEVLPVKLEDLHRSYLEYDTDNGLYTLPRKGNYLLLIFQKIDHIHGKSLFTTIRRNTFQKESYYKNQRGEVFEIRLDSTT